MKNDVFRFVALRPVAQRSPADTEIIRAAVPETGLTDFQDRVIAARSAADPAAAMREVAAQFTQTDRFVSGLDAVAPALVELQARLLAQGGAVDPNAVAAALDGIAVSSSTLRDWHARVADSLIASLILPDRPRTERRALTRALRVLSLVERLLSRRVQPRSAADVRRLYTGTLALPAGVFPLPLDDVPRRAAVAASHE